tara:strand:- start:230 stop:826 length:597 start_codon:yes stop_codon:yes gene_type:complete
MAIDNMQGKVTTTGMVDKLPIMPKGKVNPQLQADNSQPLPEDPTKPVNPFTPKPTGPVLPNKETAMGNEEQMSPIEQEFVNRIESLTDEDKQNFTNILSPSVKNTLTKLLPELSEVMEDLGTNEPNVIIPLSTVQRYAVSKYGGADGADAVNNFMADMLSPEIQQASTMETQQQTNVPPSQPTETAGLMTSPQNMEQV